MVNLECSAISWPWSQVRVRANAAGRGWFLAARASRPARRDARLVGRPASGNEWFAPPRSRLATCPAQTPGRPPLWPRHRCPVSCFSGRWRDMDRVRSRAAAVRQASTSRTAHCPARAQMAGQLAAQVAARLYEQRSVHGLVRHTLHCAGREPAQSHPSICCGDHFCSSFSSTMATNPGSRESLVGCRCPASRPCG